MGKLVDPFNRRAAQRITLVSLCLATMVTPVAWVVARDKAESQLANMAMDSSRRFLRHYDVTAIEKSPLLEANAKKAAEIITSGLFDIAEIFDGSGERLAKATTPEGAKIDEKILRGNKPSYSHAMYERLHLNNNVWAERVLIPLYPQRANSAEALGYFEGVRITPDWQREAVSSEALSAALIACVAALLCGITIYPLVVNLASENRRKEREILDSHLSMMEALGRAIAKRDSETCEHNYRVAWIAGRLGEEFGLDRQHMQALIAGSFLHDIGKIGIPDAILLKQGKLTDDETETIRTHVTHGEEIVSGLGWLGGAQEVVAAHHERWDGKGYPRGLVGEEIPLSARIFAIADVFDALSSKRPYKEALPYLDVMKILKSESGKQFDPQIMAVFERVSDNISEALSQYAGDRSRHLLHAQVSKHFDMQSVSNNYPEVRKISPETSNVIQLRGIRKS